MVRGKRQHLAFLIHILYLCTFWSSSLKLREVRTKHQAQCQIGMAHEASRADVVDGEELPAHVDHGDLDAIDHEPASLAVGDIRRLGQKATAFSIGEIPKCRSALRTRNQRAASRSMPWEEILASSSPVTGSVSGSPVPRPSRQQPET